MEARKLEHGLRMMRSRVLFAMSNNDVPVPEGAPK